MRATKPYLRKSTSGSELRWEDVAHEIPTGATREDSEDSPGGKSSEDNPETPPVTKGSRNPKKSKKKSPKKNVDTPKEQKVDKSWVEKTPTPEKGWPVLEESGPVSENPRAAASGKASKQQELDKLNKEIETMTNKLLTRPLGNDNMPQDLGDSIAHFSYVTNSCKILILNFIWMGLLGVESSCLSLYIL